MVCSILHCAARSFRDADGKPWLDAVPPLITMLPESRRPPYPVTWNEQDRLLQRLPARLQRNFQFAVSTRACATTMSAACRQGVPQYVRDHALACQRWTSPACRRKMLVQQVLQRVMAQGGAAGGREDRFVGPTVALAHPTSQDANRILAQRGATTLAALAVAIARVRRRRARCPRSEVR